LTLTFNLGTYFASFCHFSSGIRKKDRAGTVYVLHMTRFNNIVSIIIIIS